MTQGGRTSWLDCFPKITNGELQGLFRYPFTSVVQPQIVLCLLAQTRGTGRIMSGAVEPSDHDEWEAALESYGREAVAVFDGQLASHLGRHTRQVARERRRLIDAGIVVEHRRGHKGIPHILSVNLDSSQWRPIPPRSGANRFPKSDTEVSSDDMHVSQSAPESTECGSQSAPDGGNQSVPERPVCGSQSAPRFKRSSERSKSSETLNETPIPRAAEEREIGHSEGFRRAGAITSPLLRAAVERFEDTHLTKESP